MSGQGEAAAFLRAARDGDVHLVRDMLAGEPALVRAEASVPITGNPVCMEVAAWLKGQG